MDNVLSRMVLTLHTLSQDNVKILNDYFSSVFKPDKNNDELPSIDESPYPKLTCKLQG